MPGFGNATKIIAEVIIADKTGRKVLQQKWIRTSMLTALKLIKDLGSQFTERNPEKACFSRDTTRDCVPS